MHIYIHVDPFIFSSDKHLIFTVNYPTVYA